MTRLSEAPLIHDSAKIVESSPGRYTEVGTHCTVAHTRMGDYS
ncbi:MAG: hypothetical protein ACSHXI_05010 [Hoeflea sp.]